MRGLSVGKPPLDGGSKPRRGLLFGCSSLIPYTVYRLTSHPRCDRILLMNVILVPDSQMQVFVARTTDESMGKPFTALG